MEGFADASRRSRREPRGAAAEGRSRRSRNPVTTCEDVFHSVRPAIATTTAATAATAATVAASTASIAADPARQEESRKRCSRRDAPLPRPRAIRKQPVV